MASQIVHPFSDSHHHHLLYFKLLQKIIMGKIMIAKVMVRVVIRIELQEIFKTIIL